MDTKKIELTLLGTLLAEGSTKLVSEPLSKEDFSSVSNYQMYQKMVEIEEEFGHISRILLAERTGKTVFYLKSLEENFASLPSLIPYYISRMKETSWKKQLLSKFRYDRISSISKEELEVELAEFLYKSEPKNHSEVNIKKLVEELLEELMSPQKEPEMSTGLVDLDRRIGGGILRGKLYIVGARPSMGKTSLLLNIVWNLIQKGKRCLIFALEGTPKTYLKRLFSIGARVNDEKINLHQISPEDVKKIEEIKEVFSERNLVISPQARPTLEEIYSEIRRVEPDFVGLDYLQLIDTERLPGENRNQKLGYAVNKFQSFVVEFNVPFFCLSQLNREVDRRHPPVPELRDLRDCGEIEQAGDIILFLYYAYRYDQKKNVNKIQVIVGKNRDGGLGACNLYFEPEFLKFSNWMEEVNGD